MDKTTASWLGYGLLMLLVFAYGIHTKQSWRYYALTFIFIVPAGGMIGYSLGKDTDVCSTLDIDSLTFTKTTSSNDTTKTLEIIPSVPFLTIYNILTYK